jgi:methionine synthase I (cobalamin-dependent)
VRSLRLFLDVERECRNTQLTRCTLLAAYPNAGYPKHTDGRFVYHPAADYFAQAARVLRGAATRM